MNPTKDAYLTIVAQIKQLEKQKKELEKALIEQTKPEFEINQEVEINNMGLGVQYEIKSPRYIVAQRGFVNPDTGNVTWKYCYSYHKRTSEDIFEVPFSSWFTKDYFVKKENNNVAEL